MSGPLFLLAAALIPGAALWIPLRHYGHTLPAPQVKRWRTAHLLLWLLLIALTFLPFSPMNLLFGLLYRPPPSGFDPLHLGLSLMLTAPALSALVLLPPGLLLAARAARTARSTP
ncbi:hypothetical protein [Deinococcus radiophilus]|uniref:Uncharacterized protein n=1 Tax=Deinococcus radiophilus TaxID=32062 RepID=A0A3S0JPE1_9DEIO|nr:hypothetical protein [Deinococcus radiophilus]RTR26233.1 hypothetical protein EJ104_08650 [Deinococcus radiophilus]UFA50316.1 hypothetical protein LMT64_10695 [Deinococcus radiophilus]